MNKIYCTVYNFISWKRLVFIISLFLLCISCVTVMIRGFNWGLDFTGGIIIEITLKNNIEMQTIRDILKTSGFKQAIVQKFGDNRDVIIKLPIDQNKCQIINQNIHISTASILDSLNNICIIKQINWIGPSVSNNFIKTGITALLFSLVFILIYIAFRFEWRLAIGAIVSLIHDIIIILGMLSLFFIEIDSTIIAALISAIGYSLNDEIVIFDRIRENFCCMPTCKIADIFNISISQVLHRTIITSMTTIMVLFMLLIFGGSMLFGFSLTLLLGVIIGTISSVYIAAIFAFVLRIKHEHLKVHKPQKLSDL